MKKTVLLSVIASTIVMAGGDIAPVEPVVAAPEAVVEESTGKVSGQFRAFYLDRTYSGVLNNNRNSLTVGGWIGYDSAEWQGLSFGAKFYAVEGLRIHDITAQQDWADNNSWDYYDAAMHGDEGEDYGFIGEAYLNYHRGNTNLKVGRQKLNTPMAGADDARMQANLFEAAVVSNTDISDTTLILAHVTRETVGTFGNVYGAPSALSLQSGYGLGYKEGTNGNFADMGVIALGSGTDTAGVTAGAMMYNGIENLKLQAWDYYAHDIANIVYLQANYGWNCLLNNDIKMKASAQYINESDVGDKLAGTVDSSYWGVKLGAAYGALSGYIIPQQKQTTFSKV